MALAESFEREKLYAFAAGVLKGEAFSTVLDIACGDGIGASIIAKTMSGKIIGVDIDEKLITSAKKLYESDRISFKQGDCRKTGFPSVSFDAVVSLHTIEHVGDSDQRIFLTELHRILKPRGMLVLATPDRDVWELQGIAGVQEDHVKELNRKETADLLTEHHFEIVGTYGQFLLKRTKQFTMRKILNVLKRADIFRLRRFLGKGVVDSVDIATQPVSTASEVVPLTLNDRASVNVFVCRRSV